MTDPFAHHLRLDQIRDGERLDLAADETERALIARRFGMARLDRLEAHVTLTKSGKIVRVSGRLGASLEQSCVITNEPVPEHLDESFELIFMPEPSNPDDEIELAEADCDVVFYDGAMIDLGTAIADSLALSLDPYPRSAGADAALKEAGVLTEEQASPFAALAKLKKGGEQP